MRSAFQRHGAAGIDVGGVDLGAGEAERREEVEAGRLIALGGDRQRAAQNLGAERPLVEDEADVEGAAQRRLDLVDRRLGQALGAQRGMVDRRRVGERRPADGVGDHVLDRLVVVAERPERARHGLVDDLEIAAAGELLELDQGEVGLDAGGVAVHDEADRAGRGDDRDLRVAKPMHLAERQRRAPGGPRRFAQGGEGGAGLHERGVVERRRGDRKLLVAGGLAVGGALVVADDAQHRFRVRPVGREGVRSCEAISAEVA